jgi:hypothetical protein
VGSGANVRHGHGREEVEGGVVPDLVPLDDAAMAVGGVLAETDVGDHEELAALAAYRANGLLHDAVVGVPLRAEGILPLGQAEEDHARDSQGLHLAGLAGRLVGREMEAARQGRDLTANADPGSYEKRIYELLRRQTVFANQRPEARRPP